MILPRRFCLLPFIAAACFVPMNQRFIFVGLDFTVLRMLILFGILRVITRGEIRDIQWNKFDKLILSWSIVGSLVYILQQASSSSIINRAGFMYDGLGMYWIFRQMIRTWEDVFQASKMFALSAIINAPLISLEKFQESSIYSIFGETGGAFHRGRFRAAGPFPHAIMMGCFWTSLLPFFYARTKVEKHRAFYGLAIIAALSSVYFSGSSTPILTFVAIIFFWKIYSYRMYGWIIFWGSCFGLFLLHLLMNNPVWHLLARINIFGGSTGWHRFFLFDNFIKHTSEWILLGTKSTAHWGWGQEDITNQFVLEGVRGGAITLIIFTIIVFYAVKIPGKFSLSCEPLEVKWMSWGISVAMLGHFTTFWAVSYFGQINLLLYFTLALVGFTLDQIIIDAEGSKNTTMKLIL